jgi:hypothetical protein
MITRLRLRVLRSRRHRGKTAEAERQSLGLVSAIGINFG